MRLRETVDRGEIIEAFVLASPFVVSRFSMVSRETKTGMKLLFHVKPRFIEKMRHTRFLK